MGTCNSNKAKHKCLSKTNTNCVLYEGYISEDSDLQELKSNGECIVQSEVNEDLYKKIEKLEESLVFSGLEESCLEYDTECNEDIKEVSIKSVIDKHNKILEENYCEDSSSSEDSDSNSSNSNGSTLNVKGVELSIDDILNLDITNSGLDLNCIDDPCFNDNKTLKNLFKVLLVNYCNTKNDVNTNTNSNDIVFTGLNS